MKGLTIALAVAAVITFSGSALAQSGLLVEKTTYANGNVEIEVVNRSDHGIDIYGIVVNRSNSRECTLAPVGSDFGDSFLRSDLFSNPALTQIGGQWPLDAISLPFGGTVIAVAPRGCGRVLEVSIEAETADYVFSWDR